MSARPLPLVLALALVVAAQPARAGFLDGLADKAENATKRQVERNVERKAQSGVDKAMNPKLPQQPQVQRTPPAAQQGEPATERATPTELPPGEAYGNRFDFVPGDQVLVYDDFGETDVGEYPAKWTMKEGGGNPAEVVQIAGRKVFKTRYEPRGQKDSLHWLRFPVKGDMPKNFTVEFDADLDGPIAFVFSAVRHWGGQEIFFNRDGSDRKVRTPNAEGTFPPGKGLQHVAIAVSGTQIKVYVGGDRVVADSDGVKRPVKRMGIFFRQPYREAGDHQMFTALRIAEGGKPARTMLAGDGKIVTHGILFDSGKDVIKPESGPTLRAIHALLEEDADLKFSIEGHTDDQGGAKLNQPLSARRAAAVKAWLVKQGTAEGRLATKGFGQTKPIDANDTAEGRANNRRVEFVRL